MQLALYQPDIPQNVGSALRLTACFDVPCHIIEPCGFVYDDKKLKRVAMDYAELAVPVRHSSWEAFLGWMGRAEDGRMDGKKYLSSALSFPSPYPLPQGERGNQRSITSPLMGEVERSEGEGDSPRIILLSSKAKTYHHQFVFQPNDILLMGRESAGVPDAVRDACDASLRIPIAAHTRSLNVITAATVVLGEALRQTGGWLNQE